MVNAIQALKSFDIDPEYGATRSVQVIGEMIQKSSDPLGMANSVIHSLGGADVPSLPEARITAKALVEQAVVKGIEYNTEEALEYAKLKLERMKKDASFIFARQEQSTETPTTPVKTNEKKVKTQNPDGKRGRPQSKFKEQALKICSDNASLTNAQLAQLIQKQLGLTYSHSYYFSSRVFRGIK